MTYLATQTAAVGGANGPQLRIAPEKSAQPWGMIVKVNKRTVTLLAIALVVAAGNAAASKITYLSCDIPGQNGSRHFDFTLDEANSTVTFYVKEANATNTEKAVFGPETITWTNNDKYFSFTRTISRVDLSFTEEGDVAGVKSRHVGTCQLKTPKETKF